MKNETFYFIYYTFHKSMQNWAITGNSKYAKFSEDILFSMSLMWIELFCTLQWNGMHATNVCYKVLKRWHSAKTSFGWYLKPKLSLLWSFWQAEYPWAWWSPSWHGWHTSWCPQRDPRGKLLQLLGEQGQHGFGSANQSAINQWTYLISG